MIERDAKQTKLFIFFLIFLAMLQIGLRLVVSDSLERDEAEQILYFQEGFQWGYNSQPPLYNWLQIAFFHVFGLNIFALTLLKSLLIAFIYYMIYRCALLVLNHNFFALLSSLSLMVVYDFNWILHRDLTHTVMVLSVSALAVYAFLKVLNHGGTKYYFFFGLLSALGTLSKYNFILFLIALFIAAFSLQEFRELVWNKKMAWALAGGGIVLLPHVIWFFQNPSRSLVDLPQLNIDQSKSSLWGVASLSLSVFYFLLKTAGVYLIFCPAGFKKSSFADLDQTALKRFFERFFMFAFLLVASLILSFKIMFIQSRWILPFLFMIPTYYFLRHLPFPLGLRRAKAMVIFCVLAGLITTLGVPGRIFLAKASITLNQRYPYYEYLFTPRRIFLTNKRISLPNKQKFFPKASFKFGWLNFPMAEISDQIKAEGFHQGLIIAQDHLLGADLKLNFKGSFVVTPQSRMSFIPKGTFKNILIFWEDKGNDEIPREISSLLLQSDIDLHNVRKRRLTAPYKYVENSEYKVMVAIAQISGGS